ncbi:S-adenosyl-L-methionine-dependent methyltransferase [Syncephalastrum racemosum]|uniref:S-adenosyl-L-methionine-dependent methyltransferase n=1 Tax=Syncephalastrum racemosum TaxID=13706 RepID=A0A1X2HRS4_SYNRA|nr:S-adenosyl-L-methionine-dependent methyltransferase [Syncephalastrum racemosum]
MGKRRGGGRNKKDQQAWDRSKTNYKDVERDNAQFKEYYLSQNMLSPEEFEQFYEALKKPLPATFRITGTKRHAQEILEVLESVLIPSMHQITVDGQEYKPPAPLDWYPDRLGWQANVPRSVLRKSPEFARFQRFMVAESESGNISRQEAVSMVPPLLMDIQPHHWVLDMCAAPGSKTAQIIEALHANDTEALPTGLVVANDANYKRCHMLVHQTKRLQSPCFMATNHDASLFPSIHVAGAKASWQFDRVLCDVPCSGDGTLRKNESIWQSWKYDDGLSLHKLQVQIFLRGVQLTKVGGRIVYSTCSFNPIENEAVVAEVLRLTDGALELQDVSHMIPGLKRKPGLTTWQVRDKEGKPITSVNDLDKERHQRRFPVSAFPPPNAADLHLERCLRIYPHMQDTGGFFVAVFEKTKPVAAADHAADLDPSALEEEEARDDALLKSVNPEEKEEEDEEQGEGVTVPTKRPPSSPPVPTKRARQDVHKMQEAPFEIMDPDCSDVRILTDYYKLSPEFPKDQYILRSDSMSRNRTIYFCSAAVKSVLQSPDFERLHLVFTGVRLFVRQGGAAGSEGDEFRLTSEGIPLLERVIVDQHRQVSVPESALRTVLEHNNPALRDFDDTTRPILESLDVGCHILHMRISKAMDKPLKSPFTLLLPTMRAKDSVNVMVNKIEKRSLYERILGPPDTNQSNANNGSNASAEERGEGEKTP